MDIYDAIAAAIGNDLAQAEKLVPHIIPLTFYKRRAE
jgi:hypothetical protein